MGEGELKLGLRFTRDAWESVRRVAHRDGLTMRSTVETAVDWAVFFCRPAEERRTMVPPGTDIEALERVVAAAWAACERIERRYAKGRERRESLTVTIDAERHELITKCGQLRHLSVNSIVASVFTPWGSGWVPRGDPAYNLRDELWGWRVAEARKRDSDRRHWRSQEGWEPDAPELASTLLFQAGHLPNGPQRP